MARRAIRVRSGLLLEAEVAGRAQARFERQYLAATGVVITPGSPTHYQDQPNKWGAELRVYFNDHGMRVVLQAAGVHVEGPRNGYMAGSYRYRFNNSRLWWRLVEDHGLTLGLN